MAKETEFISERPTVSGVRRVGPGTIRVRKEMWRGGSRYVMNDWLTVPPVLRHLDGVTVRGLLLALFVLVAGALVARLIGGMR